MPNKVGGKVRKVLAKTQPGRGQGCRIRETGRGRQGEGRQTCADNTGMKRKIPF